MVALMMVAGGWRSCVFSAHDHEKFTSTVLRGYITSKDSKQSTVMKNVMKLCEEEGLQSVVSVSHKSRVASHKINYNNQLN